VYAGVGGHLKNKKYVIVVVVGVTNCKGDRTECVGFFFWVDCGQIDPQEKKRRRGVGLAPSLEAKSNVKP
jgi:hypothetical protein